MNTVAHQSWADITTQWEKTQKHTGWSRPDIYFPEYYGSNNTWTKLSKWHVIKKRNQCKKSIQHVKV